MNNLLFGILLFFISIANAYSQQNALPEGSSDCAGAIVLKDDSIFISETSPHGYGNFFEYPVRILPNTEEESEGEHNSVWFTFTVPSTCLLTLDIIPVSKADDYDFIIYKFTGNEKDFCENIHNRKLKPERMIVSQNDTTIDSRTGLAYHKTEHNVPPGPGESYGEALPVKKSEVYYLQLDNVHLGKGFKLMLHYINNEVKKKAFTFPPLFFNKDEATILASSLPSLDSLYITLKENPEIKIEILGHVNWPAAWKQYTDEEGLKQLSEHRAKTIYDLLVQKGIAANRMTYKGCSNLKMLFTNPSTEEEKEKNRRVEIIVVDN